MGPSGGGLGMRGLCGAWVIISVDTDSAGDATLVSLGNTSCGWCEVEGPADASNSLVAKVTRRLCDKRSIVSPAWSNTLHTLDGEGSEKWDLLIVLIGRKDVRTTSSVDGRPKGGQSSHLRSSSTHYASRVGWRHLRRHLIITSGRLSSFLATLCRYPLVARGPTDREHAVTQLCYVPSRSTLQTPRGV